MEEVGVDGSDQSVISSREGAPIFYIGTDKKRNIKAVESTQAQQPGQFPLVNRQESKVSGIKPSNPRPPMIEEGGGGGGGREKE
jgi:hypothetical protein